MKNRSPARDFFSFGVGLIQTFSFETHSVNIDLFHSGIRNNVHHTLTARERALTALRKKNWAPALSVHKLWLSFHIVSCLHTILTNYPECCY